MWAFNNRNCMKQLRSNREQLGLSQTRLARLAGVSRFKICLFELGDGQLTDDEQRKIKAALQSEVDRLRSLTATLDFAAAGAPAEATGGRAA
jgi:predicted transcriptional regulator